ncbi:30S ribosomal protein S8 [bacterium]|nr:30S ribosomal protein S8 [bacterium]
MSMTDPIADMLTRIRNANQVSHEKLEIPASKIKGEIARTLKKEGYIKHYKVIRDRKQGILKIYLRYGPKNEKILSGLKRISKSGRRVYVQNKDIPRPFKGLGIAILSTPLGILTDEECRKKNVGGEILCYVW